MFKALFNIILNLLATIVQLVMWPLNSVISSVLPDVSSKILDVTNMFGSLFNNMLWPIDIIPHSLVGVLMFVVTCEIAKHSIYISTHVIIKLWNLFQKLKFW